MRLFPIAWWLFRLTVWSLVLAIIDPRVLSHMGLDAAARFLRDHGWLRWVALPVVLPFFLFSAFSLRAGRRVSATGAGSDESKPALNPALGLREGAVRLPVDAGVIEVATWIRGGSPRCVATATIVTPADFGFSARSSRSEPAWFRGAAQGAFRRGVERGRKAADAAKALAWEAMAFLSQDPVDLSDIPVGQSVVLRTNQPALARELFSDAEVGRVIGELEHAGRRWEWSLLPDGLSSKAVLRFECRGRLEDPEVGPGVQALMSAAIRRLSGLSSWNQAAV